jgi:hypothetical protein
MCLTIAYEECWIYSPLRIPLTAGSNGVVSTDSIFSQKQLKCVIDTFVTKIKINRYQECAKYSFWGINHKLKILMLQVLFYFYVGNIKVFSKFFLIRNA